MSRLLRLGLLLRLMLTPISTRTSWLPSKLTSTLSCKLRLVAPPSLRVQAMAIVSQAWMRFGEIQISGPRSCIGTLSSSPRIPLHLLLLVRQLLLQLMFLQLLLQLPRRNRSRLMFLECQMLLLQLMLLQLLLQLPRQALARWLTRSGRAVSLRLLGTVSGLPKALPFRVSLLASATLPIWWRGRERHGSV